jgi:epoxyqueuosine reductase
MQATHIPKIEFSKVLALAQVRGFAHAGLSSIDLAHAEPGLLAWLEAQHHGSMNYMAHHGLKRARPAELVPGTACVLMVAYRYRPQDPQWVESAWATIDEPSEAFVSRYALGRDYHKLVRRQLQHLADDLQLCLKQAGWPELHYRVFCDSAPVMEVELAVQAGLGWRGKHTLLLRREEGSMFFLGSLFLSVPLEAFVSGPAKAQEHCGSCSRCLDVCPTQAIVAPYRLDARRCISYLTIEHEGSIDPALRRAMGNRIYGCDDCQLICPWNKFAQAAHDIGFAPRHGLDHASLLSLWAWSEEDFDNRMAGSAIRRIGFERWRRNLAVALGNALAALDPASPGQVGLHGAILRALQHPSSVDSPMVREHIDWALEQAL